MTLEELQKRFCRAMLGDSAAMGGLIAGNRRLSERQSLDIYRNNMRSALARALRTIYPACHRILGASCFNRLARAYMLDHTSQNSNLNNYGERFADFLAALCAEREELSEFPYLADLARLERQCHDAHYAADDSSFDFAKLAAVSENRQGDIVLQASHSLSLLSSPYPVRAIRELNLRDEPPATAVQANERREYLVIHRAPPVTVSQLSERHHHILAAILAGDRLASISERFGEIDMLNDWVISKKWLQGFHLPI